MIRGKHWPKLLRASSGESPERGGGLGRGSLGTLVLYESSWIATRAADIHGRPETAVLGWPHSLRESSSRGCAGWGVGESAGSPTAVSIFRMVAPFVIHAILCMPLAPQRSHSRTSMANTRARS